MSEARETIRGLATRITKLVTDNIRDSEYAPFIAWVRGSSHIHELFHLRRMTRANARRLLTDICSSLLDYSENPSCPDSEAIEGLITDDEALVTWCRGRGILPPVGYVLTVR